MVRGLKAPDGYFSVVLWVIRGLMPVSWQHWTRGSVELGKVQEGLTHVCWCWAVGWAFGSSQLFILQ